jgi:hypothetical protein
MTSEILTPGWQFYGLSQEHYAASIDKELFYKGTQSARLEAVSETAPGSAGIHQMLDAAVLETVGEDVVSTNICRSKLTNSASARDNSKANEHLQTFPKSPMNMDFEST